MKLFCWFSLDQLICISFESDSQQGFPNFDSFMSNPVPFPFPPNMGMGMGPGPMVKVGGFQVTMNSNGSTTVVPLTPQMLPPPEVMKRIMQVLLDTVMWFAL